MSNKILHFSIAEPQRILKTEAGSNAELTIKTLANQGLTLFAAYPLKACTAIRSPANAAKRFYAILFGVLLLSCSPFARAQLQVGAAKVDITPAPDKLPGGLTGILDHIYTRAIYVTNGKDGVLLMNVDVGKLATPYYAEVAKKVVNATGVPEDHIILSAVHDHEAPPQVGDEFPEVANEPNSILFRDNLQKALVQVAAEAKAAIQPAKWVTVRDRSS